ncbi:hypothetical protein B0H63DRAFT_454735 [Podospora didyma]|uniref:SMP domain-containing protein n=1 Tax=Podospora didyma TaxID=330526 RepID=A0AAE0N554_9PEZI|nr:hypothetical protein B0H63DRAFT_454735 [Podospora didyma]
MATTQGETQTPITQELKAAAAEGRPITVAEVSTIASAESEMTGRGPAKGGAGAVAQSIHDRQENFKAKADEVLQKPAGEVTKEDAADLMRKEARAIGDNPGKDSVSAKIQSIADKNVNANNA